MFRLIGSNKETEVFTYRYIIIEKDSSNGGGDLDAFDNTNPHEESTILHTKKFCIGSGNIIGKGVIQDLFTCAGALPTMGGSIFIELVVLRMPYLCS